MDADLLPCPFCGGPAESEDNGEFIKCQKKGCAGYTWFAAFRWQERSFNPNEAFGQFSASLKAERDFSAMLLSLIPAAQNAVDAIRNERGSRFHGMSDDSTQALDFLEQRLKSINKKLKGE